MPNRTDVFAPIAEDYAKYRPGYPTGVLDVLRRDCGLTRDWVVADIGSGTGNMARLFLEAGHQVFAVEPNREMREAAERLLGEYPGFHSIGAAAESIPLEAASVDLITVGQALHWFDADLARAEFLRILRPGGWVAVAWNDRTGAAGFADDYHALTQSFAAVHPVFCSGAPTLSTGLDRLFDSAAVHTAELPHVQRHDLEGLLGRARSSGFIPQPGEPHHAEFTARMTELFNRHQRDGGVEFHYIARLHYGRLG